MGLHRKGLVAPGEWHPVTLWPPISPVTIWRTALYFRNMIRPHVLVKVWDAREAEAREGLSKVEFFQKHSFVLLHRPTAMTGRDWMLSAPRTLDLSHFIGGYGMPEKETPISSIYAKEVEQVVRELLPDCTHIELDAQCARRGPGTKNPNYSLAVHADYGFTAEDYPMADRPDSAFRKRFESPDVRGMMVLNFWRPVLPMRGPVLKTPLAVCDPRSVDIEDALGINIRWDELGYVKMLVLAHDERQKWYFYPEMTVDEVLVFKSFQYFKSQEGPELHTCFHTAFEAPSAPPGAEERQSAEYRVRVWF